MQFPNNSGNEVQKYILNKKFSNYNRKVLQARGDSENT